MSDEKAIQIERTKQLIRVHFDPKTKRTIRDGLPLIHRRAPPTNSTCGTTHGGPTSVSSCRPKTTWTRRCRTETKGTNPKKHSFAETRKQIQQKRGRYKPIARIPQTALESHEKENKKPHRDPNRAQQLPAHDVPRPRALCWLPLTLPIIAPWKRAANKDRARRATENPANLIESPSHDTRLRKPMTESEDIILAVDNVNLARGGPHRHARS